MAEAGPGDPVVRQFWDNAQDHIRARRLPAAQSQLEQLLARNPWHVPARLLLASVVLGQGRVRGAAEQLKFAAFAQIPAGARLRFIGAMTTLFSSCNFLLLKGDKSISGM